MRVLFVSGGDFSIATDKQALWFAEELGRRGHEVMFSIGRALSTAATEGADRLPGVAPRRHRFVGRRLSRADTEAARAFAPTLIHAVNPRLETIAPAEGYQRATGSPVFVHWEDDEWTLRSDPMTRSAVRRAGRHGRRALAHLHPPQGCFVTPATLRWAAEHAAGHDALTPALAHAVRERLGVPCEVVLPATPLRTFDPAEDERPPELPQGLAGRRLAAITGTVHKASEPDLRIALEAIGRLQAAGHDIGFVHAGAALRRFDLERSAREAGLAEGTFAFLGYLPYRAIPPLLRRADFLLQPGHPTEFNRLRLPAKMQAYLASGTPTITFAVGFAELLEDGADVLKTYTGDPEELAARLASLADDTDLRQRIGAGGAVAARRLFDPERNTDVLLAHYEATLDASAAA